MLIDVNETVKTFLSTILTSNKNVCLKDRLNNIYNSLDHVDLDLCIPYLKESLLYKEIANELIELIDYYYDNIEENINDFSFLNTTTFLSVLEKKSENDTKLFR